MFKVNNGILPYKVFKTLLVCCLGMVSFVSSAEQAQGFDDFTLQDLMNMEMVSSSKFKQELSEVTASAYVITAEDIKNSAATDLPSLLKMVPGLFVAEATSNSWGMGIRGFNSVFSNKMLVMIDGRSLFSPLFSGVFWEQLDLFMPDIARIEVIRGVGSTVWGANAVNGIINIITKSTLDNESSQMYVNAGNHNKYDVGFRFGTKIAEQSYARIYVKSKDIDANPYGPSGGVVNDSWHSNVIGAKWEHFAGRDSFVLSSDLIEQSLRDPGLMTSRIDDTAVDLHNHNLNVSFQWQRQISTDQAFSLSSQIQKSWRNSDDYRVDDDVANIDFDTNYKWGEHQIVLGVGARQHDIDFEPRVGFEVTSRSQSSVTKSTILSAFVQDEWRLNEKNSIVLGTKFESHIHREKVSSLRYKADVWLPTIRYRYDVSENSRLWAAVSRSARIPSIAEHSIQIPLLIAPANSAQNPLPWSWELFTSGNDRFDKEELVSFELGYRANITPSNSVDIVAYHNRYSDVRAFKLQQPICVNSGMVPPNCAFEDSIEQLHTFENLGELDINGIEVSWLSRLSEALSLSSSYSYLNQVSEPLGVDVAFEESVSIVPRHKLGLQLDWRISDPLNLRIRHQYVSGIDDDQLPRIRAMDNFLDHFHSLDIIAVYSFSTDKKITLSVMNLLKPDGRVWVDEFPKSQASETEKRINFGINIKF